MIIHNKQVVPQHPFQKIFDDQKRIIEGLRAKKSMKQISEENPDIEFVKFDENGKIEDLPITKEFAELTNKIVK